MFKKLLKIAIPTIAILYVATFSYLYFKQIASFSFVDEFNNFIAGYFMLKGRTLYSEIFFNRQMLPAFLSATIMWLTHPNTMYKLVAYHRIFMIGFSAIFSLFLMYRLRLKGIIFVFIYEAFKFYAFGNMFQAEAMIVYPLVFLFGLIWEKFNSINLSKADYFFAAIFTWFIVFMREPVAPLALVSYFFVLFTIKPKRQEIISVAIFLALSSITVLSIPFKDYYYQLVTANSAALIGPEIANGGGSLTLLLKSFGYPIYLLFTGDSTFYRFVLIWLDIYLFVCAAYLLISKKKRLLALIIFIMFALAALRPQIPGMQFYGAYRMLPWLALLCMTTSSFISELILNKKTTPLKILILTTFFGLFLLSILSSNFFAWSRKNLSINEEFTANYARYYVAGEIVRQTSKPSDKLFIDGYDSMIFWQSKLDSPYKFAFYYPNQGVLDYYVQERLNMFKEHPPEFYARECASKANFKLPDFIVPFYTPLKSGNDPSCLYIRNDKLKEFTEDQFKLIKSFGYFL